MRRRLQAGILLVSSAFFLVAARGLAQTNDDGQPDETLPGFTSGSVFHSSGVDNVNVFSGDPGIVIPLGPAYTLSAGYSWQLKAYNSSKFWHFDTQEDCKNPSDNEKIRHAMIHGYPTLGVGWTLDPGYIGPAADGLSPYHSPDGGQMRALGLEAARLRVTTYPTGGNANCSSFPCTTIEFPDGSTQVFDHAYLRQKATGTASPDFTDEVQWGLDNTRYGLSKVIDRFEHVVLRVTWDATYPFEFTQFILYADQSVAINLTWQATPVGGSTWRTVTSIAFPMTGGQTRTVAFAYDTSHAAVARNPYDTSFGGSTLQCPNPSFTSVPYLTRIDFKSGAATLASYQSTPCFDDSYCRDLHFYGTVQKLTLPTGGAISYHYAGTSAICEGLLTGVGACPDPELASGSGLSLPLAGCPPPDDPIGKFGDFSATVYQRDELDASGNTLSTITYGRYDYVPRDTSNCAAPALTTRIARQVVVTESSGDGSTFKTNHLFHVAYFQGFDTDPDDGGREIERRYFARGAPVSGTPVRTIVNCLTTGSTEGPGVCGYRPLRNTDIHNINAYNLQGQVREQRSVTWYGDNPTTDAGGICDTSHTLPCSTSANTLWDNVAKNYQTTTLTSTLPAMAGWTSRAHTTVWNAQTGSHWLLDIFTSKSTTDAGSGLPSPVLVATNYTFDTSTGYLQSFSASDSTYGLLTHAFSTTPDAFGYATSRVLSGSGAGLSGSFTDSWSSAKNGLLSSLRTGVSWKSFDVDRDPATGRIVTSRDPNSALFITYTYDSLGRITSITPPGGEASTAIGYDSTTQTTVTRNGSDGNATLQRYLYDGLGRLTREIRQMPSGFAVRAYAFDNAGHANFVSEWGSCSIAAGDCLTAAPAGTTSSSFDLFGRVQRITRADGSVTTIDRTDGAISFSDTREAVTVTVNGGPATTVTRHDALGRIITVTEPSVGQGPEDTTYSYNVLDKLATVTQGSQTRTFAHDSFGLLRSEQTPEKGNVTYGRYDALGDVLTQGFSPSGLTVNRVYDPAGRLTSVASNEIGSPTYLSNFYDQNPAFNFSLGKLTTRIATNVGVAGSPTVSEVFVYSGLGGRLSSQSTAAGGLTTYQSWFHNSLGLVAHHYHPRPSGASFVVSTRYSAGLPVTEYVNGIPIVTSVNYQASGALGGYTTGIFTNMRTVTSITPDTSGLPRPREIAARPESTFTNLFDTGTYAYDGAGNILSMMRSGSDLDSFSYDPRSRLISASLASAGTQTYTYDSYGNLLSKGGATFCTGTCTANRVTGASYDGRGNLTGYGANSYSYDALDRMVFNQASLASSYLYNGDDERVVKIQSGAWTLTLRDEHKRIAAEFEGSIPSRDNVFLGNLVVASYANLGTGNDKAWSFYSSDHLGTPRLITDLTGAAADNPRYWPFGERITIGGSTQRMRFAAMEQDTEAGPNNDRYYDHARTHGSNLGRFLSPDELQGKSVDPQSWNRYAYALNNPLNYLDADGRDPEPPSFFQKITTTVQRFLNSIGFNYSAPVTYMEGPPKPALPTIEQVTDVVQTVVVVKSAVPKPQGSELGKDPKRRFSPTDRREAFEKAKDADGVARCEYCGGELDPKAGSTDSYEADHRDPHSKGGRSTKENLAPACRDCNRDKSNKTLDEWKPSEPQQ
jgi:RHS repeat-associated protein